MAIGPVPAVATTPAGTLRRALVAVIALLAVAWPATPVRADQSEHPGSPFSASISAGLNHTCGVLSNGAVRCWGNNGSGQLGITNTTTIGDDELAVTNVNLGGVVATAVAAGGAHSCALLSGGAVRCWGSNFTGQLGFGSTATIGDDENPTVNANLGTTATAVTAGAAHTCALLTGGAVRCWGYSGSGQLGLGSTTTIGDNEMPTADVPLGANAIAIAAGASHTCAILAGGHVRCWGLNLYGQLGIGNTSTIGDNEVPTANVNLGGATAIAISAGGSHTCALLTGGSIRCWGVNDSGQLGIGSTAFIGDDESPTTDVDLGGATATSISAGEAHTCAVLTSGAIRCWGQNINGQLGLGNTARIGDNEGVTTDVNLGAGITATAVSAGFEHTCALLIGGSVRCWGRSSVGQLGLGNTSSIGDNEVPTLNTQLLGTTATAIAAGGSHTCALLTAGAVRCWGANENGQLGLGNTTNIGDNESPTTNVNLSTGATAITAGDTFTCALLAGGAVRCWGYNATGQLGLGNTQTIGDDESPTANVNLSGATATAISAGGGFACALLSGGAVRCWGANWNGQLGLANTNIIGDDESPTTNVNLSGATAIAIAAGDTHTCALLTGGGVRCWGYGGDGRLGLGNTDTIGDNESPTTNVYTDGVTATAITTGLAHTCGLFRGGAVRCWGYGAYGQLGFGNTAVPGLNDTRAFVQLHGVVATAVTAGAYHSCALVAGGAVRCWGYNLNGELGLGSTDRTVDDPTTGVNLDDARIGPNQSPPIVSITAPTPRQTLPSSPVTITGTASDDTSVTTVSVAIFRNVNGGQYWNGTGWQAGNIIVPAGLTNPGTPSTGWTYTFNAPPGGIFAIAAIAYDQTGNYAIAPYQTFAITDTVNPNITLTTPAPSQAFAAKPVTIAGTATDNAGVGDVQIAIYRPLYPNGQFWNGTTWQPTYTTVTATLANAGATNTTFAYSFNAQAGGYFYAAAIALDTSYRYSLTAFTLFTLPDNTPPTAEILSPAAGYTTGTITINGTATDDISVNHVGIAIYRPSTSLYWNGTAWQPDFGTIPANLDAPGNTTTSFTTYFTPPLYGFYLIAALPIDGNYNYTLTPFTAINHT